MFYYTFYFQLLMLIIVLHILAKQKQNIGRVLFIWLYISAGTADTFIPVFKQVLAWCNG